MEFLNAARVKTGLRHQSNLMRVEGLFFFTQPMGEHAQSPHEGLQPRWPGVVCQFSRGR
jgi:hypothetical protein